MTPETLAIFYGLASALSWGAGDFSGGMATKQTTAYSVVFVSQFVGGLFLGTLALLFRESVPSANDLFFGALAGFAGVIGVFGFYSGLAYGRMGIVAPLTAVLSAAIPIVVSLFIEGIPPPLQLLGFSLALFAVWLLSGAAGGTAVQSQEIGYALMAGIGFAFFFILIDQANDTTVFWPLVMARVTSVTLMGLFIGWRGVWQRPSRRHLPLIISAGILDAMGTAFFALSARLGRLDLAAVLSSLYPATTVLLAQLVLQERLNRPQWTGVVMALAALILITL